MHSLHSKPSVFPCCLHIRGWKHQVRERWQSTCCTVTRFGGPCGLFFFLKIKKERLWKLVSLLPPKGFPAALVRVLVHYTLSGPYEDRGSSSVRAEHRTLLQCHGGNLPHLWPPSSLLIFLPTGTGCSSLRSWNNKVANLCFPGKIKNTVSVLQVLNHWFAFMI